MSLPERYSKRVRSALNAIAVWQPGTPLTLGAIMGRNDGIYHQKDDIRRFGNPPLNEAPHLDKSLDLVSSGIRQTIIQGGVELPDAGKLDLTAKASVKLEFTREFEYVLKTATLKGSHLTNLNEIAQAVSKRPDWQHDRFWVVYELYTAEQFSFTGSEKKGEKIEVSGSGAGVLSFLTVGASVGITATGNAAVKIVGQGGPVAMGLVRFRKDGSLDFTP